MKKVQQRHQKSNYVNTMLKCVTNLQKIVYVNYYALLISNIILLFFYRSHPSGYKEKKIAVFQFIQQKHNFLHYLVNLMSILHTCNKLSKYSFFEMRYWQRQSGSTVQWFSVSDLLSTMSESLLCQLQLGDLGEVN